MRRRPMKTNLRRSNRQRRGHETASKVDASQWQRSASDRSNSGSKDWISEWLSMSHRVAIDAQQGPAPHSKRYAKAFPFSFGTARPTRCRMALPVGRFGTESNTPTWKTANQSGALGDNPPLHLAINAAVDDLIQSGPHQSPRHCRDQPDGTQLSIQSEHPMPF